MISCKRKLPTVQEKLLDRRAIKGLGGLELSARNGNRSILDLKAAGECASIK